MAKQDTTIRDAAEPSAKLSTKAYEAELRKLHGKLVKLQEWVKHAGLKVVIVFEGRDTAGKGGAIKAITERVSPRTFRVVALPAPSDREKSQMYIQRYLPHLPAAGEVVIFDRSWYNRAGVERVMGFCSDKDVQKFLDAVPKVEKAMVDSGIILIKYWLEVSPEEQTRRLEARIKDDAQDLEIDANGPQILFPLVRLLARPRRHVQVHALGMGTVDRGPLRRQEKGAPQHHQ